MSDQPQRGSDRDDRLRLAGTALFAAGCIIVMGIITSEAFYPLVYTTGGNEISDLGGTRPPAGLVFQPSATIFNLTMMATGLLVLLGSWLGHHRFGRPTTFAIGVLGASVLGVGIFPGNTGTPHAALAMFAFFSGGFAAVLSARSVTAPLRYVLVLLGAVNLLALASYFALGDANPLWVLGVGGAERWVVYPVILWLIGFGGSVGGLAPTARDASGNSAGSSERRAASRRAS
jgi:hypothetical membrane protein